MARYADRLLADGERVALRGRQHVLATIIQGRVPWALFIASVALLVLTSLLERDLMRDLFAWLALALMLIGLVWLVQIYAGWFAQDYVITNRRVMKVEGVLKKRSADSSLEKINDAVLEQSVLGRILGYGDLDILTANEQSVDRYRMLSQAQTFKRTMLDQKHNLEQEAFQIPAPPLRAPGSVPSMVPASQGAAAGGGVAAPPRREMTSEQITSALGNLADLRDRGAITPEEYEAKKRDLLERL